MEFELKIGLAGRTDESRVRKRPTWAQSVPGRTCRFVQLPGPGRLYCGRALTRAPCFPAIFEGLPVGGVDGTLRSAFRRTPHGKRVHAKTGTLVYASAIGNRWVYVSKGLAGYFDAGGAGKPDDLVAFAIIIAGALADDRTEGSARIVRAQESIIDAVVEAAGLLSGS